MVRTGTVAVIVAGLLLGAGAAWAQTGGPSLEPAPRAIVPVTGPSVVPSLPEPVKPDMVPPVTQGPASSSEGSLKAGTAQPSKTKATRSASHTAKTAHKQTTKTAAKKATPPKHVAKSSGTAKTKHVAAVKHQPPAHHATVGKPVPVSKRQAPGKEPSTTEPVLPRV